MSRWSDSCWNDYHFNYHLSAVRSTAELVDIEIQQKTYSPNFECCIADKIEMIEWNIEVLNFVLVIACDDNRAER